MSSKYTKKTSFFIIRRGFKTLLIFQSKQALQELAPCFFFEKPVAGFHRASPSTSLDKNPDYVFFLGSKTKKHLIRRDVLVLFLSFRTKRSAGIGTAFFL